MSRTRTAILVSGRGTNMHALIEAARDPDYPAEIVAVISNRPNAPALTAAAEAGVPAVTVDHKTFPDRTAFEAQLERALTADGVELLCLAGFMRILSPSFVTRWAKRALNIHPSLLPAFIGLDTHARALEAGVAIHGCTVHFVTEKLDAGPIIGQAATAVRPTDDADTLAARVLRLEHQLYPACLADVARGAVDLVEGRAVGVKRTFFETNDAQIA